MAVQRLTVDQLAAVLGASDARPPQVSDAAMYELVHAVVQRLTMAALGDGVTIKLAQSADAVLMVQVWPESEVPS